MAILATQQESFKSLYISGASMREIARKECCSVSSVKKYLLKQGVTVRTNNIVKAVQRDDDILIGTYCGVWAGDGTQYYDNGYTIKICCHSDNYRLITFIQDLLRDLVGKRTYVRYEKNHRALIRFKSRYIYEFIKEYVDYGKHKTYSVCLKKPVQNYSHSFLRGFLLGLMLSDGYLKKSLKFCTTSVQLCEQVKEILRLFGYHPSIYIHRNRPTHWKPLHMVSLGRTESNTIRKELDKTTHHIQTNANFTYIKYGPARI